ncbi:hypothetical protein QUA74_08335 [Microcoleus sp. LAD1_D3]|uniref:hypothetical protein n=1 Tax=Microcoleus sp. LAD1_D3 TaxID=2819365 RepID=UPI002FD5A04B
MLQGKLATKKQAHLIYEQAEALGWATRAKGKFASKFGSNELDKLEFGFDYFA